MRYAFIPSLLVLLMPTLLATACSVASGGNSVGTGAPMGPVDVVEEPVEDTTPGCLTNEDCFELLAPLAPCDKGVCDVDTGTCRRQGKETGTAAKTGMCVRRMTPALGARA